MAPSFCIELSETEKARLLEIARQSIEMGLVNGDSLRLDGETLGGTLAEQFGAFVTLTQLEQLRGCMGALESPNPLAHTVASCAFNAAFRDPRFSRCKASELAGTRIEISVLSQMQAIVVTDRQNLLGQLRPEVDGLLLEDGSYRSTFLPQVWEKIGSAEEFLGQLLSKAGLSFDYWSETIRFQRYQTISFSE